MSRSKRLWAFCAFVFFACWLVAPLYGGEPAMKVDELLAKHLDSIGSVEARAAAKTRVVHGAVTYRLLVGGAGRLDGTLGLVTDGNKIRFMMKMAQNDYKGENLAFNGKEVQVAYSTASQTRSPFSTFVLAQDEIVREGLLGGVLSTGWSLLDLPDHKAKLEYQGLKKVDGHQVQEVRYWSPKSRDIEILLYFDAENFHHIKTLYSLSIGNSMAHDSLSGVGNAGGSISGSNNIKPDRLTLEERFSEFKTEDGLTLPTHWSLEFTRELPNGSTTVSQWDLHDYKITNNLGIDPLNFKVQ